MTRIYMSSLHLKVITPKKIVLEEEVSSVTIPSVNGELTILPRHTNFFALLSEGIITIKKSGKEDYMAIGGGYVETNGKELHILVSRAYGQDAIDENLTNKAIENAENMLKNARETKDRHHAASLLRRSLIDMKLLRKRRRSS